MPSRFTCLMIVLRHKDLYTPISVFYLHGEGSLLHETLLYTRYTKHVHLTFVTVEISVVSFQYGYTMHVILYKFHFVSFRFMLPRMRLKSNKKRGKLSHYNYTRSEGLGPCPKVQYHTPPPPPILLQIWGNPPISGKISSLCYYFILAELETDW